MDTIVYQSRALILDINNNENDDLQPWIEMFLRTGRSRNLAIGTVEFYAKKLSIFLSYCSDMAISNVCQITPETIRNFLLFLEERHHKPGGIHCFYSIPEVV